MIVDLILSIESNYNCQTYSENGIKCSKRLRKISQKSVLTFFGDSKLLFYVGKVTGRVAAMGCVLEKVEETV